ncbi:MAG: hypothetical protein ACI9US_002142, partial [Gammaproteobacteria bacterium]
PQDNQKGHLCFIDILPCMKKEDSCDVQAIS